TLELTRNSVAAQIVFGKWDFGDPVAPGRHIAVRMPMTNIGHMPAIYSVNAVVFHWARMPEGDIPLVAPEPQETMESNIPSFEAMFDTEVASDEFIYGIPHLSRDM